MPYTNITQPPVPFNFLAASPAPPSAFLEMVRKCLEVAFALPYLQNLLTNPLSKGRGLFRAFFGLAATRGARVYKLRGYSNNAYIPPPRIGRSLRSRGLLGGGVFAQVTSFDFAVLKVRASRE